MELTTQTFVWQRRRRLRLRVALRRWLRKQQQMRTVRLGEAQMRGLSDALLRDIGREDLIGQRLPEYRRVWF